MKSNRDITTKEVIEKLAYCEKLVGKTVYFRAACECINTVRDKTTGFTECPFEYGCEYEECHNGNERIFETIIDSIFNDGNGWYCSFKHFCFTVPIEDFGKTIFLTKEEYCNSAVAKPTRCETMI